jgi:O-acetyl-ADP-ribose deacetylase (regulator of RNase III)
MIFYLPNSSVFDAPVTTVVNTVNCDGVMGKGLALEVKKRYPRVFNSYRKACERGTLTTGKLQLVKAEDRWILNFPTKDHWRAKSKLAYVEAGLKKFVATYKRKGITSVAFPPLGCGHGGLNWQDVQPLMQSYLESLPDVRIYICLAMPIAIPAQPRRRTSED